MKKVFIILVVLVFCFLVYLGKPLSETQAIKKAENICMKFDAYCSGYHLDMTDGSAFIVFRTKYLDQEVDTINVATEEIAKKIYHLYSK